MTEKSFRSGKAILDFGNSGFTAGLYVGFVPKAGLTEKQGLPLSIWISDALVTQKKMSVGQKVSREESNPSQEARELCAKQNPGSICPLDSVKEILTCRYH